MRKILILIVFLCLTVGSSGVLSARASEEAKFSDNEIAAVGKYMITTEEFLKDIDILHMSSRVGRAIQGDKRAFPKQDFSKFLKERVENKLILREAERLGLDKEEDIAEKLKLKRMNLLLDRLRDEEINKKVVVTEEEILEYFIDDTIRQKKEKAQREESLLKPHDGLGGEAGDGGGPDSKQEVFVEPDKKARAEIGAVMTNADYRVIRDGFIKIKTREIEQEFFSSLKKKVRIKIYKKVIKKITEGDVGIADSTIAKIGREKITARYVWVRMEKDEWKDAQKVRAMVDSVVLHKLLDKAASEKGYEDSEDFKKTMFKFKEITLVDAFRSRVIERLIKVKDKDIEDYYKNNKSYFKYPDEVKLSIIKVNREEEALGIIEELGLGSDFAYLAKNQSLHSSRVNGGDLGWVKITDYPGLDVNNVRSVSKGSIAGPFREGFAHVILQLNGYKEGKIMPLDEVRSAVDAIVGRGMVEPTLVEYIKRLKKSIPIRYNKVKLAEFGVNIE